MRRLLCLCLVLLAAAGGCESRDRPQSLSKVEIEIAGRKLAVEAAVTPSQRGTGMMYRRKLAADEGMLFVFPRDDNLAFYMKNTYVPLSIAFIRSDGVIVNLSNMEPLSLKPHGSLMPCRFALEMPQGWFVRNGVAEGSRVKIPALGAE